MARNSAEDGWREMNILTCSSCNLKTSDSALHQAHHCKPKARQTTAAVSYNRNNEKYTCSLCRVELSECDFSEHLEAHISLKPYICSYCDMDAATKNDMYEHVIVCHGQCECKFLLRQTGKAKEIMMGAKNKGKHVYTPLKVFLDQVTSKQSEPVSKSIQLQESVIVSAASTEKATAPSLHHLFPPPASSNLSQVQGPVFPVTQGAVHCERPHLTSPHLSSLHISNGRTYSKRPQLSSDQQRFILARPDTMQRSESLATTPSTNIGLLLATPPYAQAKMLEPSWIFPSSTRNENQFVSTNFPQVGQDIQSHRTETQMVSTAPFNYLSKVHGSTIPPVADMIGEHYTNGALASQIEVKNRRSIHEIGNSNRGNLERSVRNESRSLNKNLMNSGSHIATSTGYEAVANSSTHTQQGSCSEAAVLRDVPTSVNSDWPTEIGIQDVMSLSVNLDEFEQNYASYATFNINAESTITNVSEQEKSVGSNNYSYLRVVKGYFLCLKCRMKWCNEHSLFFKHIWQKHVHGVDFSCCPMGYSTDCVRLRAVVSAIYKSQEPMSDQVRSYFMNKDTVSEHTHSPDMCVYSSVAHHSSSTTESQFNVEIDVQSASATPSRGMFLRNVPDIPQQNLSVETLSCFEESVCPPNTVFNPEQLSTSVLPYGWGNRQNQVLEDLASDNGRYEESLNSLGQGVRKQTLSEAITSIAEEVETSRNLAEQHQINIGISSLNKTAVSNNFNHQGSKINANTYEDISDDGYGDGSCRSVHGNRDMLSGNNYTEELPLDLSKRAPQSVASVISTQLSSVNEADATGPIIRTDRISTESLETTNSNETSLKFFYQCGFEDCLFATSKPLNFQAHYQQTHGSEKQFQCIYCGFRNSSSKHLINHMKEHIGNAKSKTFSCSFLENSDKVAQFENNDIKFILRMLSTSFAANTDSDIVLHCACNICSSEFGSLEELEEHLQKSLLKVISCKHCNSYFLNYYSCQKHMATEHVDLPRLCDINEKLLCYDRKINTSSKSTETTRNEFEMNPLGNESKSQNVNCHMFNVQTDSEERIHMVLPVHNQIQSGNHQQNSLLNHLMVPVPRNVKNPLTVVNMLDSFDASDNSDDFLTSVQANAANYIRNIDDEQPLLHIANTRRDSGYGQPLTSTVSDIIDRNDGQPQTCTLRDRKDNDYRQPLTRTVSDIIDRIDGQPQKCTLRDRRDNDYGQPLTHAVSDRRVNNSQEQHPTNIVSDRRASNGHEQHPTLIVSDRRASNDHKQYPTHIVSDRRDSSCHEQHPALTVSDRRASNGHEQHPTLTVSDRRASNGHEQHPTIIVSDRRDSSCHEQHPTLVSDRRASNDHEQHPTLIVSDRRASNESDQHPTLIVSDRRASNESDQHPTLTVSDRRSSNDHEQHPTLIVSDRRASNDHEQHPTLIVSDRKASNDHEQHRTLIVSDRRDSNDHEQHPTLIVSDRRASNDSDQHPTLTIGASRDNVCEQSNTHDFGVIREFSDPLNSGIDVSQVDHFVNATFKKHVRRTNVCESIKTRHSLSVLNAQGGVHLDDNIKSSLEKNVNSDKVSDICVLNGEMDTFSVAVNNSFIHTGECLQKERKQTNMLSCNQRQSTAEMYKQVTGDNHNSIVSAELVDETSLLPAPILVENCFNDRLEKELISTKDTDKHSVFQQSEGHSANDFNIFQTKGGSQIQTTHVSQFSAICHTGTDVGTLDDHGIKKKSLGSAPFPNQISNNSTFNQEWVDRPTVSHISDKRPHQEGECLILSQKCGSRKVMTEIIRNVDVGNESLQHDLSQSKTGLRTTPIKQNELASNNILSMDKTKVNTEEHVFYSDLRKESDINPGLENSQKNKSLASSSRVTEVQETALHDLPISNKEHDSASNIVRNISPKQLLNLPKFIQSTDNHHAGLDHAVLPIKYKFQALLRKSILKSKKSSHFTQKGSSASKPLLQTSEETKNADNSTVHRLIDKCGTTVMDKCLKSLYTVFEGKYVCKRCKRNFITLKRIHCHSFLCQGKIGVVYCSGCPYEGEQEKAVKVHIKLQHCDNIRDVTVQYRQFRTSEFMETLKSELVSSETFSEICAKLPFSKHAVNSDLNPLVNGGITSEGISLFLTPEKESSLVSTEHQFNSGESNRKSQARKFSPIIPETAKLDTLTISKNKEAFTSEFASSENVRCFNPGTTLTVISENSGQQKIQECSTVLSNKVFYTQNLNPLAVGKNEENTNSDLACSETMNMTNNSGSSVMRIVHNKGTSEARKLNKDNKVSHSGVAIKRKSEQTCHEMINEKETTPGVTCSESELKISNVVKAVHSGDTLQKTTQSNKEKVNHPDTTLREKHKLKQKDTAKADARKSENSLDAGDTAAITPETEICIKIGHSGNKFKHKSKDKLDEIIVHRGIKTDKKVQKKCTTATSESNSKSATAGSDKQIETGSMNTCKTLSESGHNHEIRAIESAKCSTKIKAICSVTTVNRQLVDGENEEINLPGTTRSDNNETENELSGYELDTTMTTEVAKPSDGTNVKYSHSVPETVETDNILSCNDGAVRKSDTEHKREGTESIRPNKKTIASHSDSAVRRESVTVQQRRMNDSKTSKTTKEIKATHKDTGIQKSDNHLESAEITRSSSKINDFDFTNKRKSVEGHNGRINTQINRSVAELNNTLNDTEVEQLSENEYNERTSIRKDHPSDKSSKLIYSNATVKSQSRSKLDDDSSSETTRPCKKMRVSHNDSPIEVMTKDALNENILAKKYAKITKGAGDISNNPIVKRKSGEVLENASKQRKSETVFQSSNETQYNDLDIADPTPSTQCSVIPSVIPCSSLALKKQRMPNKDKLDKISKVSSNSSQPLPSSSPQLVPLTRSQPVPSGHLAKQRNHAIYKCINCNFTCKWNIYTMEEHINNEHPYYSCGYCDAPYTSLTFLQNHQKFVHRRMKPHIVKGTISLNLLFKRIDECTSTEVTDIGSQPLVSSPKREKKKHKTNSDSVSKKYENNALSSNVEVSTTNNQPNLPDVGSKVLSGKSKKVKELSNSQSVLHARKSNTDNREPSKPLSIFEQFQMDVHLPSGHEEAASEKWMNSSSPNTVSSHATKTDRNIFEGSSFMNNAEFDIGISNACQTKSNKVINMSNSHHSNAEKTSTFVAKMFKLRLPIPENICVKRNIQSAPDSSQHCNVTQKKEHTNIHLNEQHNLNQCSLLKATASMENLPPHETVYKDTFVNGSGPSLTSTDAYDQHKSANSLSKVSKSAAYFKKHNKVPKFKSATELNHFETYSDWRLPSIKIKKKDLGLVDISHASNLSSNITNDHDDHQKAKKISKTLGAELSDDMKTLNKAVIPKLYIKIGAEKNCGMWTVNQLETKAAVEGVQNMEFEPENMRSAIRRESLTLQKTSKVPKHSGSSCGKYLLIKDTVLGETSYKYKKEVSKTEYPFRCTLCRRLVRCLNDIEEHFQECHPTDTVQLTERISGLVYSSSGQCLGGKDHRKAPEHPHVCKYCPFRSTERSDVKGHISVVHPLKDVLVFSLENPRSPMHETSTELSPGVTFEDQAPRSNSSTVAYYHCIMCNSVESSEFLFRLHLAKHPCFRHTSPLSTGASFVCPTCGYIAKSNNDLAKHTGEHMSERRFKCFICGHDSHTKKGVKTHLRSFHNISTDYEGSVIDRKKLKCSKLRPRLVNINPCVLLEHLQPSLDYNEFSDV